MPLPQLLLIALLLLTSCGGGNGTSTTPAPTTPPAAAPPSPPPVPTAARVFACVTDVRRLFTASQRSIFHTYTQRPGGQLHARTLPPSLFTEESLEGGTPTWNSVIWYPGRVGTRFGAFRDGMSLFQGFDLQPVLRNPSELQVVLRPPEGGVWPFPVSVGEEGEPYFLSYAAYSLLESRADESWSMALTDDGEDVSAVFDDSACGPPG